MVQVGPDRIQRMLSLVSAHIGRSIRDVGEIIIDDQPESPAPTTP